MHLYFNHILSSKNLISLGFGISSILNNKTLKHTQKLKSLKAQEFKRRNTLTYLRKKIWSFLQYAIFK